MLGACDQGYTPRPDPPKPQFTKAEFSSHVYGKTKAEVRQEFGAPTAVNDKTDSWYYEDRALNVYDADAGIRTLVWIRFSGAPSPDDTVVDVSY